jgi:hypothetical protein
MMHAMDGWVPPVQVYKDRRSTVQYLFRFASLRLARIGGRGVTRDSDLDSTLSTDPLLAGAWSTAVVSFR